MSKLSLCILCCPQNKLEMRGFPYCIVHDNYIFLIHTQKYCDIRSPNPNLDLYMV